MSRKKSGGNWQFDLKLSRWIVNELVYTYFSHDEEVCFLLYNFILIDECLPNRFNYCRAFILYSHRQRNVYCLLDGQVRPHEMCVCASQIMLFMSILDLPSRKKLSLTLLRIRLWPWEANKINHVHPHGWCEWVSVIPIRWAILSSSKGWVILPLTKTTSPACSFSALL